MTKAQALLNWIDERIHALGKFSAAQAKSYMQQHFGVDNAKAVPGSEWPRLHAALSEAVK